MFTFVGVQPSVPSPIAEGQRQEGQDPGKSAGRSLRGQDQSQGRTLLLLREAIQNGEEAGIVIQESESGKIVIQESR